MYDLVEKSDVFVQNFRKGVAERLGLGYDDLKKHKPDIVYGAATGYGPDGPDSHKPAFAYTGEARSGSLWWAGPDDGVPYNLQGIADQAAGIMLSYGILGALVARERTGVGQKVDVSHLGSMMWLGGNTNGIALLTGNDPRRQDRRTARNVLWNAYKCRDDRWIAFSMNQSDRYWHGFCDVIERPELVEDPHYNGMEARAENRVELIKLLDDHFTTRTREEWMEAFSRPEHSDLVWERVQDVWDLPEDPQVIENEYIVDFDHPVLGPTKWLQTPLTYSETPVATKKMAPELGEDTEEILLETLGYSWDDIGKLQAESVIL